MATQEFYIRNETDSAGRGPYNFEQVSSRSEAGQITPATLFCAAATEQWVAFRTKAERLPLVIVAGAAVGGMGMLSGYLRSL
jgi:hypothetical protein